MRLTPDQINTIREATASVAGQAARVWLFGSRVDDTALGGDVDLLLELDAPVEEPAMLAAQLSARVSRAMYGRNVDVVVKAPGLAILSIHNTALREGVLL